MENTHCLPLTQNTHLRADRDLVAGYTFDDRCHGHCHWHWHDFERLRRRQSSPRFSSLLVISLQFSATKLAYNLGQTVALYNYIKSNSCTPTVGEKLLLSPSRKRRASKWVRKFRERRWRHPRGTIINRMTSWYALLTSRISPTACEHVPWRRRHFGRLTSYSYFIF